MNIALFGGAFDPPHLGHQQVAAALLAKKIVDEVWYVPVKQHPFSKQLRTTDDHRLAMLDLIQQPGTRTEMYELENDEVSLSYITLKNLSTTYPEHTFSWVIGSDNLKDFHKWDFYQEMLQEFTFYVYPRAGYVFDPVYPGMIPLKDMQEVVVSSTEIRNRIENGQSIDSLVDARVAAYIAQHQLYQ
jgi:nicotinate-nucleotide adenylyltransferase